MSGTILFKNGNRQEVTNGLSKTAVQLLSERSGLSRTMITSEIAYLPMNMSSRIWAICFRNYIVKVQLDERSHASLLRRLKKKRNEEQAKYAHLRKRVLRATQLPANATKVIQHAADARMIIKPN